MARVEDWAYRLVFLAHVHPDKAVRTAAEACGLKWTALVVNFDRKGLALDEMEILLHELGHAVQNNLDTTRPHPA